MMKNILLFILVGLVSWMSQDYFSIKLPIQEPVNYSEPHKTTQIHNKPTDTEKRVNKHMVKQKDKRISSASSLTNNAKNNKQDKLSLLLSKHKFYEAMEHYLDSSSMLKMKYAKVLRAYLSSSAKSDPQRALLYMQAYLEEVPESKITSLMIETYIEQKDYQKAVAMIIQAKENYSNEQEDINLARQLKSTAKTYIDTLTKDENYGELIAFLENMMDYDDSGSYYSFTLAKLYMDLEKHKKH